MRALTSKHRQSGISLVELLIALLLGVVLSYGVVNLFLQLRVSQEEDDQIARLQENGRWALRYLSRELSMAGFLGNMLEGNTVASSLAVSGDCGANWALDTGIPFEHLDNTDGFSAQAQYACLGSGDVALGTDVIALRRTKDSPTMLDGTAAANVTDETVYLSLEQFGAVGELVRGSDFSAEDTTAGSGIDAWEYLARLIFVREYSRSPGDGIPSLCVKRLSTDAASLEMDDTLCLVEGVENFQVEFGLDRDVPPDYTADFYTSTPTAAELAQAVTARLYVLVRSLSELPDYTNDKSFQMGATTQGPKNDGYYRRLMQTTVVLRNGEVFGF